MLKKLLPIAAIILVFANCTQDYIPTEELSNKDRMNELVITDPLVWNSLTTQRIEIDTTGSRMKAGTGMTNEKEYPDKGYYFSIFEDLYPSQGDYDFNDVILQTKVLLDIKNGDIWGTVKTTVANDGGQLETQIGLMFYSVKGNNEYTVIDNSNIIINDKQLADDDNFIIDLPAEGENIEVKYHVSDNINNVNQIWIAWYIVVKSGDELKEIHTAGFPASNNRNFEIPQRDYLTLNNLPWGIEIEAEEFAVPIEKAFFMDAYPEFKVWAESEGVKNTNWYKNPDNEYTER